LEIQKLYDLDDIEFEDIAIGLVRLAKDIPAHEFFYKINQNNNLTFKKKDVILHGAYYDYFFQDLRPTTSLQRPVLPLFRTNLLKVNKKNSDRTLLRRRKH
jgi:hypothetical protein